MSGPWSMRFFGDGGGSVVVVVDGCDIRDSGGGGNANDDGDGAGKANDGRNDGSDDF